MAFSFALMLVVVASGTGASFSGHAALDKRPDVAAGLAGSSYEGQPAAYRCLTVVILDDATGDTLCARCAVIDCLSVVRYPSVMSFYHTAMGGYFYSDGSFSLVLPEGRMTVKAGHGFEYRPMITTVDLRSDTTVTLNLSRIADLRGQLWYSGDIHFHLKHGSGVYFLKPEHGHFFGLAEDLAVLNCLDSYSGFTGAPDPSSCPYCIIYISEEVRSGVWGHYGLLGLQRLIEPYGSDWGPLLLDYADSTHSQPGAIVVAAHPVSSYDFDQITAWPGSGIARELPIDIARGKIDAFEIMSYSNCGANGIETALWYNLLNCGFKLPACGGTDALPNYLDSNPIGGNRTYVRIPGDQFGYYEWLDGVVKGRTFVTNGPLFARFNVFDREAGDSLDVFSGHFNIPVSIRVKSVWPLLAAQIVANGEVVRTLYPSFDPCVIDTIVNIDMRESAWIASRVFGENNGWLPVGGYLFAHTSPVYITIGGKPVLKRESAEYFVRWIDDLLDIVRRRDWPSKADSVTAAEALIGGREYYQGLLGVPCDADDPAAQPIPVPSIEILFMPNPMSSGTMIRFATKGIEIGSPFRVRQAGDKEVEMIDLTIYDAAGRVVRRLYRGRLDSASFDRFWDGKDDRGIDVASGIYFCRAVAGGAGKSEKIVVVR